MPERKLRNNAASAPAVVTPSRKHLFVVGCPRSGTTWMSWLLSRHPATVVSLHTGFFQALERHLGWFDAPKDFGNRIVATAGGTEEGDGRVVTLADVLPRAELHRACRPLAECLFEAVARVNPEASWVIEKTPENLLHADLIRAVLPDAAFLHVIRDPRAVFSSMRMASRQWAFPGDLPASPITFARRYWNAYIDAGERLAAADNYFAVRYEDLLEDGVDRLAAVFRWMGLPADSGLCERAVEAGAIDRMRSDLSAPRGFFRSGRAEGWREELSGSQVRLIEHLCGERMERFGYHCSGARTDRAPVRLRLADSVTEMGRKLVRGPLGRPLRGLFGRARSSVETVRGMMGGS